MSADNGGQPASSAPDGWWRQVIDDAERGAMAAGLLLAACGGNRPRAAGVHAAALLSNTGNTREQLAAFCAVLQQQLFLATQ